MDTFTIIILVCIPVFLFIIGAYIYKNINLENKKSPNKKNISQKRITDKHTNAQIISYKLQAYERLVLFLERIEIISIINKIPTSDMSSYPLPTLIINTIQQEYEYNLTQQVYISNQLWEHIQGYKEKIIADILFIHKLLYKKNVSINTLKEKIIHYFSQNENNNNMRKLLIQALKTEAKTIM